MSVGDGNALIERLRKERDAAVAQIERLSSRERQVLFLVAEGESNKHIARKLSISPRTVEIHRAHMMSKLGVKNAIGITRIAVIASMMDHETDRAGTLPGDEMAPAGAADANR